MYIELLNNNEDWTQQVVLHYHAGHNPIPAHRTKLYIANQCIEINPT